MAVELESRRRRTASKAPVPKVLTATAGSGVGVAIAVVLGWFMAQFGITMAPEVANSFALLVISGATFLGGWLMPQE